VLVLPLDEALADELELELELDPQAASNSMEPMLTPTAIPFLNRL
jgi:hypothetical protein